MPKKPRREKGVVIRGHHLLPQPIINCLRDGDRAAWVIEEDLATLFHVTKAERSLFHPESGCPVWRNDVAFGLSQLVQDGVIIKVGKRRAPPGYGGVCGIYRLAQQEVA